jgi:uncharacterized membrane protein YphA (DoxX/SURF4 family)
VSLSWAAGIGLGLVLLASGVSKIASRSWPAQAAALRAPSWSVPLVPGLELVIGAALVVHLGYPATAVVAVALLVAFSALLTWNLAAGRRPPCACFGVRSTRPIGPWSLVRNGGLVALALIAAVA